MPTKGKGFQGASTAKFTINEKQNEPGPQLIHKRRKNNTGANGLSLSICGLGMFV